MLLTVFLVDVYLSFPSSMTENIFFTKTHGVYRVCWFSVIDDGKYIFYKNTLLITVCFASRASAPLSEIFFVT